MRNKVKAGIVTIPGDADVKPHEKETAQSLARAGYSVEFVAKGNERHQKTADVLIEGLPWEFKAPTASNSRAVQRNLRRALHQSNRVVFDSRRMKDVPDFVVERELRSLAASMRSLKGLLFIDHHGKVIAIC